jgi:hypothetical protein
MNFTPIRRSWRQTISQAFRRPSLATSRIKLSGNHKGLVTSSAAPESEMLRTVQGKVPPPNSIDPVLNIRRLGAIRFSFVKPQPPR